MKSSLYYIILAVISSIIFFYTLWKKRDRKLVALYFFTVGVTYFMEYFVLVIFKGYAYNPGIFKQEYIDNITGAIVSDAFTIPMFSVFIAGFRMKFLKRFLIALAILGVEILYVKVGIYVHFWWSYLYSFIGANIFFYFAQKWLYKLHKPLKRSDTFAILFFSNLAMQASTVFLLASVLGKYIYIVKWFDDSYRSHSAFATLYIIFISIVFVSLIVFKLNWIWICVGIAIPSLIDIILINSHILRILHDWSLLNFIIFRIFILTCIYLFNKHLLLHNKIDG